MRQQLEAQDIKSLRESYSERCHGSEAAGGCSLSHSALQSRLWPLVVLCGISRFPGWGNPKPWLQGDQTNLGLWKRFSSVFYSEDKKESHKRGGDCTNESCLELCQCPKALLFFMENLQYSHIKFFQKKIHLGMLIAFWALKLLWVYLRYMYNPAYLPKF